jgi:hypothetical protein
MVNAIDKFWGSIYMNVFVRAEAHDLSGNDDIFMGFSPSLMSAAWSGEPLDDPKTQMGIFFTVEKSNLSEHIDGMQGNKRRLSLLNVSEVVRIIQSAEKDLAASASRSTERTESDTVLNAVHDAPEPVKEAHNG